MNNKRLQHRTLKIILAAITIAAFGSTALGQRTDEQGYVLIIQQSPVGSGIITPGVGVYRPKLNQTVAIQANPKLGYKFIYWMGDVASPTSNRTSVRLDSPKIVIAVFEKENFELLSPSNVSASGIAGGGATTKPTESAGEAVIHIEQPQWPPYQMPDFTWPYVPVPGDGDVEPPDNEIPVPGNDFEVPVPESDFEIPVPGFPDGGEMPVPGFPGDSEMPVPGDGSGIPVPDEENAIPDFGEDNIIPEPATMAMLAAGTMFLRKRKRKPTQK